MVVPPGIEPGTFSVLTRCHNQLDHGTVTPDVLQLNPYKFMITDTYKSRYGNLFQPRSPCNKTLKHT
ncbi:hypothetical protein CEP54_004300 [Fusarium duplospermum]|uniref:Uncharacterized protein n=1 Tax=Fusarium duplospermum TaxID=1325734 RepID=A0A428QJ23_9HYPO|nr:hypothetical protein CEP54_004300 [Fusarium duplospermum]